MLCTLIDIRGDYAFVKYKETGDLSAFYNIAQDSVVMNLDDLLCIGATDGFVLSNTIGRNAHRVNGEAIKAVIDGYTDFCKMLGEYGVGIIMSGWLGAVNYGMIAANDTEAYLTQTEEE